MGLLACVFFAYFMKNHLTIPTVLSLNANWQAIDVFSPEKAFCMMATGVAVGLDTGEGGMIPVKWNDWINLPCREGDDAAQTTKGRVRIPRVIIAVNYRAVKPKKIAPTKMNLAKRQGYICAYTGRRIDGKTVSVDHVLPRSRGGGNDWGNLVAAHKEINNKKGNRTPEEAGLKLLIRHKNEPFKMPKDIIREDYGIKFSEWAPFISN
jgi:5-methylcytosine-specific restriction endonuclease McrA